MSIDAPEAGGDRPTGGRVSIAERAARRQQLEQQGYDGAQGLLRYLKEGRGETVARRGRWDLVFHPIARKLVLAFLVLAAAYVAISFVAGQVRDVRIDTWTGPDATVQSGMRLEACPALRRTDDPVFPNWIRIDGRVYQPTGAQLPIGPSNIGRYYVDSGYTLDNLRIYRVEHDGLGEPGSRILVRAGDAPAGGLFGVIPGCG